MRGARRLSVAAAGVMLAAAGSGCGSPGGGGTAVPSAAPLAWSVVASPAVPTGLTDPSLAAVACVTATDCWAVGAAKATGQSSQALIEQLVAGSWGIAAAPIPPESTFSVLEGVSCTGDGTCWAVGYSIDASGLADTLIEQDTGAGWSIVPSPAQPDGDAGFLNGVTCTAGGECWGAGAVVDAEGNSGTLVEQDTGGGWSIVPTPPAPSGVTSELNAVSCPDSGDCWASGDLVDSSGAVQVLTEQDAGSGWIVVTSPSASGQEPSSLGAVICASRNDCWAVGDYADLSGTSHVLVEHDRGSGWGVVSTPTPPGATGGQLAAVTCVTADDCWAVGDSLESGGGSRALIEQEGGGGWTVVAGPAGPGSRSNQLSGLTCVSAVECWAVGSEAGSGSSSGSALIEQGR